MTISRPAPGSTRALTVQEGGRTSFNSLTFLFLFLPLPLALVVYWRLTTRNLRSVACVASPRGREYSGFIMNLNSAELREHDDRPVGDQCVHLHGTFDDYEALLRIRGECSFPRIAYLEGNMVIVTPSREHEGLTSLIGCLVDTYCVCFRKRFRKIGSWTLKERKEEGGVEPDECYIFGDTDRVRPDLAIEVIWTAAGIDKLEIHRRLQVREVWIWQRGQIAVHGLQGDRYEIIGKSEVLPGIDLDHLVQFLDRPTTYDAMVDYRAALESSPG